MSTIENEIFNEISGCCISDDAALSAAKKVLKLMEGKYSITETPFTCEKCAAEVYSHHKYCWGCGQKLWNEISTKQCHQCINYDKQQQVYTEECYSCKRYNGDLFEQRKSIPLQGDEMDFLPDSKI